MKILLCYGILVFIRLPDFLRPNTTLCLQSFFIITLPILARSKLTRTARDLPRFCLDFSRFCLDFLRICLDFPGFYLDFPRNLPGFLRIFPAHRRNSTPLNFYRKGTSTTNSEFIRIHIEIVNFASLLESTATQSYTSFEDLHLPRR